MPQKVSSIKYTDMAVGMTFYTDDYENSGGMTPFELKTMYDEKGNSNILILECINKRTGMEQIVKINKNVPRDIYVTNLSQMGWRKSWVADISEISNIH